MSRGPIGMMDSGLGGLSVWREVHRLLPAESLYYVADSAHCPYGSRPAEEVYDLSRQIVDFLLAQGCKLIVLACNTATAVAIESLRKSYDLSFVGMEPALKPAAKLTRTGIIGILATENTFKGEHFRRTRHAFAQEKEVRVQPGYGLVELVERGNLDGSVAEATLRPLLEPMINSEIDQLVLGCTHYPFLLKEIRNILGEGVNVIDPSPAVARQVRRVLAKENKLSNSENPAFRFFTTASIPQISSFLDMHIPESMNLDRVFDKIWLKN